MHHEITTSAERQRELIDMLKKKTPDEIEAIWEAIIYMENESECGLVEFHSPGVPMIWWVEQVQTNRAF
jgi:hypothetical protein